jgi:hypothetical protein
VSHASTTQVYNLEPTQALLVGWYYGATYEVTPIASGSYLALSFALSHASKHSVCPRLPDMGRATVRLRTVLDKWRRDGYLDSRNLVVHTLDRHYPRENLNSAILEGTDAHKIAHLRSVAEDLGFVVCLANLEYDASPAHDPRGRKRIKLDSGACDADGEFGGGSDGDSDDGFTDLDVAKLNLEFRHMVDLEGTKLPSSGSLLIVKQDLLPTNPFEGVNPGADGCA